MRSPSGLPQVPPCETTHPRGGTGDSVEGDGRPWVPYVLRTGTRGVSTDRTPVRSLTNGDRTSTPEGVGKDPLSVRPLTSLWVRVEGVRFNPLQKSGVHTLSATGSPSPEVFNFMCHQFRFVFVSFLGFSFATLLHPSTPGSAAGPLPLVPPTTPLVPRSRALSTCVSTCTGTLSESPHVGSLCRVPGFVHVRG